MIEAVGGSVKSKSGLIGFLIGDNSLKIAGGGARAFDGEFFANINGTFDEKFAGIDAGDGIVRIINKGVLYCVGDWLKGRRISGG